MAVGSGMQPGMGGRFARRWAAACLVLLGMFLLPASAHADDHDDDRDNLVSYTEARRKLSDDLRQALATPSVAGVSWRARLTTAGW